MRATLHSDPSKGPGFGIIDISGVEATREPSFLLHRASDGLSLSPNGWQEAETALRPDAWDADGGSLRLAVGPAIVDNMDALDTYRLTVRARNTGVCALTVRDLVYSSLDGGQGIVTARPTPPPPAPAPEPPAPKPEPPLEMSPAATEAPLDMRPPATEPQPRPRGKALLLLGIPVLLLLCGGAVWWFLPRPVETPGARPPADAPTQSASAQPAPSTTTTTRPVPPPLTVAREHLKSGGDAAGSLALARGMTTPEAADAAFLLVEDAAQKGNAEAMFRLAAFYDPADTHPKGSIAADPIQARLWYMKARDNGHAGAEAALAALRAWAEAAAAKGDAAAKAALAAWK